MSKLTDKQELFCKEYLVDLNATQAAVRAGYSSKTAQRIGSENLGKPYLRLVIDSELEKARSMLEADLELTKVDLPIATLKEIQEKLGSECNVKSWIRKTILIAASDENLIDLKKLRRGSLSKARYSVLERAGFKCQCCGVKPSKDNDVTLDVDHVVPFSMGGSDDLENLQILCSACNRSKSNNYAFDHNDGW